MGVREFVKERPMLGWGLAAVLMLVAVWAVALRGRGGETAELTEMVTIRCVETGKTWQLPRGVVEKELMLRPFPVDPKVGLPNPDTGRPTGFPADDWEMTVTRINADREAEMRERRSPTGRD